MDADQRSVALERAYADVIRNISKEAEARVMVSERKSQQLEHELRVTKDEAVQKILRLKMLMDEKIREAKNTSQNQQEKIDELEAQLQEAEDILGELRKELRYVQGKYERMTRNDMQHLDIQENATSQIAFVENRQYIPHSLSCPLQSQKFSLIASDKENLYLNQRTEYPEFPSQLIQMKNSYGNKLELPSIIRRSENRNRFTQRIHAYERNVLDGVQVTNNASNEGKEGEQTEKSTCDATIDGVDKMFYIGSKEAMHKDDSVSRWYNVQAMNLISGKGETTPKYTENKSTVRKKDPHILFMKMNGTPSDTNRKSYRSNTEPNRDPTLIAPKLSLNMASIPTQPEFTKTTKMKVDEDKGDTGTMINKGESPVDMSVPIVQEEGPSTKHLDILVSKLNPKKINEAEQYCELKPTDATSEGPSLPVDKRIINNTFWKRRKRKTVSIGKGNVSAKNNTSLRKKARENGSAEPNKSILVSASSLSFYLYGR